MKKLVVVNGGPRKNWNTNTLLKAAAEGARSVGAAVRCYDLYDLDYTGCKSCYACKRATNAPVICVVQDGLRQLLEDIHSADALLVGSPVYFLEVTGMTRCFLERLLYPLITYDRVDNPETFTRFPRRLKTEWLFTMGVEEGIARASGNYAKFDNYQALFKRLLGDCEYFTATDTCHIDDYSQYAASKFDPIHKKARKRELSTVEAQEAFVIGAGLVS
ncbi:MAG: flavodoxin family protein [Eggerthellaceae bacterium]|nr:flavodoxin family protein [Eggerthellaceae bacterium]